MDLVLIAPVIVLGLLIAALSAYGVISPGGLINLVTGSWHMGWRFYLAVGVRIVLGMALLGAASLSRYPLAFQILGAISLVAALGLAAVGRERVGRLLAWFQARTSTLLTRVACLLGMAFGGFLMHAVV